MSNVFQDITRTFASKMMMMDILLWVLQALLAAVCLFFTGIQKTVLDEKTLVAKGQTGVEGLSPGLIRFIGISELLIAAGLILPWWLKILPVLTPIAAGCFGLIMVLAARAHYRRFKRTGIPKEKKNVINNLFLLLVALFICAGRLAGW